MILYEFSSLMYIDKEKFPDSRNPVTWLNGEYINGENALHISTHSLHYAGSVFEGIRSYNGKIFKLEQHIARLFYSMKLMKLKSKFTEQDIIKATEEVLQKSNLKNSYIRPLVYRGPEALKVSHGEFNANIAILVLPATNYSELVQCKIVESKWKKAPEVSMPHQCKGSGNYMINIISAREALENGFDDSLMLDYNDYISECTTTNIFFLQDNKLITPKPKHCLNGITRQTIINLAAKIGYHTEEKNIRVNELSNFSESFSTGTVAEIKSIASITLLDNNKINFPSSALGQKLLMEYQKLVNS